MRFYPDGRALLVHGRLHERDAFGFHRFDLRTGEVKPVLEDKGLTGNLEHNPTFSPDGRYLYFKHWDRPEGFDPKDQSRAHVARLELATGQVAEVFRPQR